MRPAAPPRWRAGVAVLGACAAGAVVAAVHLARQLRQFRFSGNVGESAPGEWTAIAAVLRQGSWFLPESASPAVFAAIAVWGLLAAVGAAEAWRRKRWFAVALVVPLLVHTVLGFRLGTPRSLAIKYLTASFPAWVLLTALGALAAHGMVAARRKALAHGLAGALALGVGALAWPRAAAVAFGDGSHFRELRAALPATAGDGQPPLLIGPPHLRALAELYAEHLGMAPMRFVDGREMPPWRAAALVRKGAHIVVAGDRAEPPAVPGVTFRRVLQTRSSFTPHWSWTLFAPVTIPPDTIAGDGEVARPGHLVDSAPFDRLNGPQRVAVPGEPEPRLAWLFVANEVAVYELAVPADAENFFVETIHDAPGPPVFELRGDGRILSVQAVRSTDPPRVVRLRARVPEDLRGRTCRWRVRFLGGNTLPRANDDETNAGYILAVGFETRALPTDGLELLRRELLVSPPTILRDPMEALRAGLGDRLLAVGEARVSFRREDGETIMRIDADEERPDGPILIPAFTVVPGQIAYIECELRAVGVTDHQLSAMVGCVPEGGGPTRDRLFSLEPVGPGTTPWRSQVLFAGIPEGVSALAAGWYVTRGANPVPKEGHFEVRRLRFLDAEELAVPSPEPKGPLPLY